MHVIAMIHQGRDGYGVSFPDFPGCTTVAKDLDSAVTKASEALAFHAEGLAEDGPLPQPRSLNELQSDPHFLQDAKDAVLVLVPYEPPSRAVRINVTVEEALLARIDRAAHTVGETRSGYLATSARLRMGTSHERVISRSRDHGSINWTEPVNPSESQQPYWKGFLKLSLVSCPITLYPASSNIERISFTPINRRTGKQLQHQYVDADTGEPVAREDAGRGYKLRTGEYLAIEDDDFQNIQIDSMQTIELNTFVSSGEVDIPDVERVYYAVPSTEVGQEAFAVIREAMRSKGMFGIGQIVLGNRERPIALGAFGKGLRALTLRYPSELRSSAEYFADIRQIRVSKDMRILAEHIIEAKVANFDPSGFEDRYELAVADMLKRKQAGMPTRPTTQPRAPSNVINLIDALKRSVKTERKRSALN